MSRVGRLKDNQTVAVFAKGEEKRRIRCSKVVLYPDRWVLEYLDSGRTLTETILKADGWISEEIKGSVEAGASTVAPSEHAEDLASGQSLQRRKYGNPGDITKELPGEYNARAHQSEPGFFGKPEELIMFDAHVTKNAVEQEARIRLAQIQAKRKGLITMGLPMGDVKTDF